MMNTTYSFNTLQDVLALENLARELRKHIARGENRSEARKMVQDAERYVKSLQASLEADRETARAARVKP